MGGVDYDLCGDLDVIQQLKEKVQKATEELKDCQTLAPPEA